MMRLQEAHIKTDEVCSTEEFLCLCKAVFVGIIHIHIYLQAVFSSTAFMARRCISSEELINVEPLAGMAWHNLQILTFLH